jgi:hypothetical protein
MVNTKTHIIMAQLSISFGLGFDSLPGINQGLVKVAHRSSITANESDFGDIYDEYEDFEFTSQVWR